MHLLCAGRILELDSAVVMGVLNVTPDSFYDGGRFADPAAALSQAQRMAEEGAAIIDIGGESTRPGAHSITSAQELSRVLPVVERVAARVPALISIDTSNPELMRRAAAAGAHMINDVRALRVPEALQAAADSKLAICLVHMLGEPPDMQRAPHYDRAPEQPHENYRGRRAARPREDPARGQSGLAGAGTRYAGASRA